MSRTLIDIDDDLLRRAAEALGTGTKKATVNAALAEVVKAELRSRQAPVAGVLSPLVEAGLVATCLHYDADFDVIAEVTGQPVQWVVPRGTADAPRT